MIAGKFLDDHYKVGTIGVRLPSDSRMRAQEGLHGLQPSAMGPPLLEGAMGGGPSLREKVPQGAKAPPKRRGDTMPTP